ncbi:hypothetical protein HAALTHF_52490n [Vreelandella aquamarina]|nr:hypothetical protein HAALTHF_52490n [Halomonas axialensis]
MLQHANITLRQGDVSELQQAQQASQTAQWQVTLASGETLQADHVVVATASLANQFAQTAELPLQQVRGQVSELTLPAGTKVPTKVVCAGGYVSPPMDNVLTFGASFVPNNATTQVVEEEHQRNIDELRQALPEWVAALEAAGVTLSPEALEGRAAVRAASPDKTPYAGPVPHTAAWQRDYAVLRKDASKVPPVNGEHHPGLWISTAHGSRGLPARRCARRLSHRAFAMNRCPSSSHWLTTFTQGGASLARWCGLSNRPLLHHLLTLAQRSATGRGSSLRSFPALGRGQ